MQYKRTMERLNTETEASIFNFKNMIEAEKTIHAQSAILGLLVITNVVTVIICLALAITK